MYQIRAQQAGTLFLLVFNKELFFIHLVLIFVFYCILCVFLPHLYLPKKHAFRTKI
jgi:hypothetical protein